MPKIKDSEIAAAAKAAGFSGNHLVTAVAVALAESGGDTTATNRNNNGTTDYGLWQINTVHGDLLKSGNWQNPIDNAKMAMAVYKKQGWTAWYAYKPLGGGIGPYAKFQGRAMLAAGNPANIQNVDWYPDWLPGPDTPSLPGPSDIPGISHILELLQKIWDAVQGLVSGTKTLVEFVGELGKGIVWLADSDNWKRTGMFVGGMALFLIGIARMTNAEKGAINAALLAVPGGKVAGSVGKSIGKSTAKAAAKTGAKTVAKNVAQNAAVKKVAGTVIKEAA